MTKGAAWLFDTRRGMAAVAGFSAMALTNWLARWRDDDPAVSLGRDVQDEINRRRSEFRKLVRPA
jgi:hypothetical protein